MQVPSASIIRMNKMVFFGMLTLFYNMFFEHCWCIQQCGHAKIIGLLQWSLSDVADSAAARVGPNEVAIER